MIRIHHRYFALPIGLILLLLVPTVLSGQDGSDDVIGISTDQLLRDALLFSAELSVRSPESNEALWNTTVNKITIPGRAVSVSLDGDDARLEVVFTLYPADDGRYLLVARSETWFEGEYNSALTSLPIEYRDEVYYYPLGRAANGSGDNPVEILVKINVVPYLETLDSESRAALESALDSSAQFHLTED